MNFQMQNLIIIQLNVLILFTNGDLPPLLENNGYAYMSVLVNKFNINEILGKVIIIHSMPDDFNSQPAGNSGMKIACGKIEKSFSINNLNIKF